MDRHWGLNLLCCNLGFRAVPVPPVPGRQTKNRNSVFFVFVVMRFHMNINHVFRIEPECRKIQYYRSVRTINNPMAISVHPFTLF